MNIFLGVSASMWIQDEQVLSFRFWLWNFYILALSWLFKVAYELNRKHLYLQMSSGLQISSVHSCESLGLCHFSEHKITKGQGPSEQK